MGWKTYPSGIIDIFFFLKCTLDSQIKRLEAIFLYYFFLTLQYISVCLELTSLTPCKNTSIQIVECGAKLESSKKKKKKNGKKTGKGRLGHHCWIQKWAKYQWILSSDCLPVSSVFPTLVPQQKVHFWPHNKSFIDWACSVKMAWYWHQGGCS